MSTEEHDHQHQMEEELSNSEPLVEDSQPVPCPDCKKEFKNAHGLAVHSKKCGKVNSFTCSACHVVFSSKFRLTTHLKNCKVIKQQEEKIIEEKKQAERIKDYQSQIEDLKLEVQKTKEDGIRMVEAKEEEWKSRMDSEIQMRELLISHLQKSYAQLQEERKDLIGKRDRLETQLAEAMKEMSLDKHRITDLATKFLEKAMATM